MTVVVPVSVDWLALREEADARSRSRPLAMEVARMLRPPVTVHDLGSGTGSMMRWLTARLPGAQTWVLHDWNHELLEHAATQHAASQDAVAQPAGDGTGMPTVVRTNVAHLGLLREEDLAGASLVTTSALLDVLTRDEVEAIVRACVATGAPALFSLTVTGRVEIDPVDPGDRVFEAAFNDHQRRTGDRRLLGPDAVGVVAGLFRSAGWSVRVADSPWRLADADLVLIQEWMGGWLAAAVEERPALQEWAEEYGRTRAGQLAAGSLRVVVHHEDLLAWPP